MSVLGVERSVLLYAAKRQTARNSHVLIAVRVSTLLTATILAQDCLHSCQRRRTKALSEGWLSSHSAHLVGTTIEGAIDRDPNVVVSCLDIMGAPNRSNVVRCIDSARASRKNMNQADLVRMRSNLLSMNCD